MNAESTKAPAEGPSRPGRGSGREQPRSEELRGRTVVAHDGPPPRDPDAISRVVKRVEILNIELIGAHFDRRDAGPLPAAPPADTAPDLGIGAEWRLSDDGAILGCVLSFATLFDEPTDNEEVPYQLVARFRLTYSIDPGEPLAEDDVQQFVFWNAVFNAWPYWREYLSSTINRANLPRFTAPVMQVPK